MATAWHQERLRTIERELLECGARRVVDLGCGSGELLQRLRRHRQFRRLIGIDIDERELVASRRALGLDWLRAHAQLEVRYGSFEEVAPDLVGIDAAVMLETIEHIDPGRLSRVEQAVFGGMRPATVLITTPNREFNHLLGLAPGERRHPGHRFEWDRGRFRQWAGGVAVRHDYAVGFADLGPGDAAHGSATQMARFTRTARG